MEYGMPTMIELPGIRDCAALCRELGMQFVEINRNLPLYQSDQERWAEIRAVTEETGIDCTIHMDERFDPFDLNEILREAHWRMFSETAAMAREIHAPVINMHLLPGVYFTLPEGRVYLYEKYKGEYLRYVCGFSEMVSRCLGGTGILLCIENCGGYTEFHREALEVLLQNGNIALTFDVGHNYGAGGVDEPWILAHRDRLKHFHLHDWAAGKDHRVLGEGEVALEGYLALAGETGGRVVIETKTVAGLRASASYLREGENNGNSPA